MKSKSSVSGNSQPNKKASEATKGEWSGSSDHKGFNVIPIEDRHLVRKHGGLGLQDYWLDCWEADPFGSRYVLMPDANLKSSTHRKYRKQLKELGLFLFEIRQDGANYQLWVLNRHGSRVKSYWHNTKTQTVERGDEIVECDPKHAAQIVERGVQIVECDGATVERGDEIVEAKSKTLTQQAFQNLSISSQYLNSISSSISLAAESGEEEFKILNKKEEVDQGEGKPEGISTPESLTALVDQPEQTSQPKDPKVDQCSAAPHKNENQSHTEDAALLKWLVEVKIPSLELDEPPRNLEAYARGMTRRDGDALLAEFEEVQGDHQFQSRCAELTAKVEARADEWRKAGIPLTVFWDSSGMPAVILNGSAIAANDFLVKPIKPPTTDQVAGFNRENSENRKARQSRLKCAGMIGECPGLEFLIECWGDVLLQAQVKALIAKHPEWGIWVEQLCEFVT